jgi:hypothetical protein
MSNWWTTSDLLAKLSVAGGTIGAIAVVAFFINQFQIPDDTPIVRGELGQFIFNERPEAFIVTTPDSFLTLCNTVPVGTTMIGLRTVKWDTIIKAPVSSVMDKYNIIRTEDSLWLEKILPPDPPEPEEPGYHFAFDEGVGDTTRTNFGDVFGILDGAAWGDGYNGSCILFSEATARVSIRPPIDSPSPDSLKMSVWIKPNSFTVPDARIVSKATGTSGAEHWWMISTYNGGAIRFRLKTDTGNTTLVSEFGVIETGNWHHVVCRYDGEVMSIAVDGAVVGTCPKTGLISPDPSVPVSVGNQPPGAGDRPFDGLVDELEIR